MTRVKIWPYFTEEDVKRIELNRMMNFVTDNTALDLAKKVFGEEAVIAFCKEQGMDRRKKLIPMKGENFLKEVMRRGCNSVHFMEWCISTLDVSIPELFDEAGNSFLHVAAVKYQS